MRHPRGHKTPRCPSARRLRIEPLEDRRMLAVATVTTELDVVNFNDGVTSLREAIFATNTLAGADTIEFAPGMSGKTIHLNQALGELHITDSLTIDASSLAGGLTIDAGDGADGIFGTGDGIRIFNIDDGLVGATIDVVVTSLTLTGGDIDGPGGAISTSENLTLTQSIVTCNSTSGSGLPLGSGGGGLYGKYCDMTVVNCVISYNSTAGYVSSGGGIKNLFGRLTITQSEIIGNRTRGDGSRGGGISSNGFLTIERSSVSNNDTLGYFSIGGGIYFHGYHPAMEGLGSLSISNSTISGNHTLGLEARGGGIGAFQLEESVISHTTISGNSTIDRGGGLFVPGEIVIVHCTITENLAPEGLGSGIATLGTSVSEIMIGSSIVAGNLGTEDLAVLTLGEDPVVNPYSSLGYNLVGSGNSFDSGLHNAVDNFTSNDLTGVANPLLGALANNGGPTQTHALLPGSPAIDAGNPNFAGPPDFDQRGGPYQRVFGGRIDIGAYEAQPPKADFDGDHDVDGNDFLIWQVGFGVGAAHAEGDADGDMDVDAVDLAIWEAEYGLVDVVETPSLTVTTLLDVVNPYDTLTSLREAIAFANVQPGGDQVAFAAQLAGGTIFLTGGELHITEAITISAPGAGAITIDAQQQSRIFNFTAASGNLMLDRLTLTQGRVTGNNETAADHLYNGGAIRFLGTGQLVLDDCQVIANSTSGSHTAGGGIFVQAGHVSLEHTVVANNSSTGHSADGGGLAAGGSVWVYGSTIASNTASGSLSRGGGLLANFGAVTLIDSTVSGNTSSGVAATGGGIYALGAVSLTRSTVSGNSTNYYGAGIHAKGDMLTIFQSTITGNTAVGEGGGIFGRTIVLDGSIVAANSASYGADIMLYASGAVNARYSILGDGTDVTLSGNVGNLIGATGSEIDPLLGALADNGGPTLTHLPLAGSPAINLGDPSIAFSPSAFDQRGNPFSRVINGRIDIGAVEVQAAPLAAPVVDAAIVQLPLVVDWRSDSDASGDEPQATAAQQDDTFAALADSVGDDEYAAVILAGEHELDLVGHLAERDLADEAFESLGDVPLGGEFFPDF